MKKLTGYKVISKYRRSIFVNLDRPLIYHKNQLTIPNKDCGPLCVFAYRLMAERFSIMFTGSTVVPCIYIQSKLKSVWLIGSGRLLLQYLPSDTVLADSVTCLE